jgi:hypothetical protein
VWLAEHVILRTDQVLTRDLTHHFPMPVQAAPAPSGSRGELSLQPAYFTSSLFVGPLRDDVLTLTHIFVEQYARSQERPFALFKRIWDEQGWVWMHFRVIDSRAREVFLNVTCRSFLGKCLPARSPTMDR